jgi:hypothetical protein
MRMFIAGQWTEAQDTIEVLNPFDGSLVDTVPHAGPKEVDQALESASWPNCLPMNAIASSPRLPACSGRSRKILLFLSPRNRAKPCGNPDSRSSGPQKP